MLSFLNYKLSLCIAMPISIVMYFLYSALLELISLHFEMLCDMTFEFMK